MIIKKKNLCAARKLLSGRVKETKKYQVYIDSHCAEGWRIQSTPKAEGETGIDKAIPVGGSYRAWKWLDPAGGVQSLRYASTPYRLTVLGSRIEIP